MIIRGGGGEVRTPLHSPTSGYSYFDFASNNFYSNHMVHMQAFGIRLSLNNALLKRSSLASNSSFAHSILQHKRIHISLTLFQIFGGLSSSSAFKCNILHFALHFNMAFKCLEAILNL